MKKMLRFCSGLLLTVAVLPASAQFVSTGPNGGAVNGFYRDGATILAAATGGAYSSMDNGKSWQELAVAPAEFGCDPLYCIASSGNLIFAGSLQSGIFRSTDGGQSWQAANSGLGVLPNSPFSDIEIVGPHVLTIRRDSGFLYISTNQGFTWGRINIAIGNAFAQYLSVHNNELFVTTPQGIYKSTDNGSSFTNINSQSSDYGRPYWSGDTLYVATANGVRMSADNGQTFSTVALSGRAVRAVAVNGKNMYAIVREPAPIQDSVLYSSNGGNSFSAAPFQSSNFRFTIVNDLVAHGNGALVASDYGLYGSGNGGAQWGKADSGFNATSVKGLGVSGNYVLAAAAPMGVYRVQPDSGSLKWQHSGDVAHNVDGNVQCLSAKGAYVHAGGTKGYYRSTDSGGTWTAGATGVSGGNVTSVFAQPASSDVWMIRNGNLFYSSDDGNSFGQVVNSNVPAGLAIRVMKADTTIFVASFGSLYKAGATMSFSQATGINSIVTGVVFRGGTYYASTFANGLYSSTNGATWNPVVITPPAILPAKINTLITDGTILYAGTDDGYFSDSAGVWLQRGLAGRAVQSLAIRNNKLFAGTCSGVYSIPYKIPIIDPGGVASIGSKYTALQVIPNPSNGNVTLSIAASKSEQVTITVQDITGKVLLQQHNALHAGTNQVQVHAASLQLSAGIYLIQVAGAETRAVGRMQVR